MTAILWGTISRGEPEPARPISKEKADKPDRIDLEERFGEQNFVPKGGFLLWQGRALPELVWEHPELVNTVLDDPKIPTCWFSERFEEVKIAR